jgi:hypothetical protein
MNSWYFVVRSKAVPLGQYQLGPPSCSQSLRRRLGRKRGGERDERSLVLLYI